MIEIAVITAIVNIIAVVTMIVQLGLPALSLLLLVGAGREHGMWSATRTTGLTLIMLYDVHIPRGCMLVLCMGLRAQCNADTMYRLRAPGI